MKVDRLQNDKQLQNWKKLITEVKCFYSYVNWSLDEQGKLKLF